MFRCLRIFASKSELTSRAKIQLLELKCKYFVQIFQWNTQKIHHMSDNQVLRSIVEHLRYHNGLKQKQIAQSLGVSPQYFSDLLNGRYQLSQLMRERLVRAFPATEYLLEQPVGAGRSGSSMGSSLPGGEFRVQSGSASVAQADGEASDALRQAALRPHIPYTAAAGRLTEALTGIGSGECEMRPMVGGVADYDFSISVSGESMEPTYVDGDTLLCRFIRERTFIQWGQPHVIDTTQGIVLKRILPGASAESIICRSDNGALYPDFEVPGADIFSLSLVVGLVRGPGHRA